MFKGIMAPIAEGLSGDAAKEYVAGIASYHRVQASPGFRQAALYVHGILRSEGIPAEVLSFAGDGRTFYWASQVPPEWDASAAELWLVAPAAERRKLADFRECKFSLIQRSDATPPEGLEAELVVLDDGTEEAHYQGLDVQGRLVLTSAADLHRVRELAVYGHGALGLLYDGMLESPPVRSRIDVPDARQYVSFWQAGDGKRPCVGFSLSPRQGDWLRKLAKQSLPGSPVRLWARVNARFVADGHTEVVSALLPGTSDEEVMVVAHLCHPQPSANDNASGAGAALEIARTLNALLKNGKLAQPKRGIRFLWVPEMTGTYAYLASQPERMSRTIAGVNLDMVGQNQEVCGSSFLIERVPRSMPSFVDDLMISLLDELLKETKSHSGQGGYALFRHAITPFSGGSDHYILSDPSVGIPCPMLIQWPDRYYHTSLDTIDKVDPASLRRAGVLAATYAYFLACAERAEAEWLGLEMLARFKSQVVATIQTHLTEIMQGYAHGAARGRQSMRRRVEWDLAYELQAFASLRRLSADVQTSPLQEEARSFAEGQLAFAEAALLCRASQPSTDVPSSASGLGSDEWETRAAGIVPVRQLPGPVSLVGYLPRLSVREREEWHAFSKTHSQQLRLLPHLALFWCDGHRTLLEIIDAVELETGQRAAEVLVTYFELLRKLDLVRWG